jgi:hypothetical protein
VELKMKKIIPGPDYEVVDFHIRYSCPFSLEMRAAVKELGINVQPAIEGVVEDIDGNEEVANSLKHPLPGCREVRQVDIRQSADGPIILKTFVEWYEEKRMWVVYAEGGHETYWEEFQKHGHGWGEG